MKGRMAGPWRDVAFRRFAIANGLSLSGDQYAQVVLPLAVLAHSGAVTAGLVLGARALATTCLLLVGGTLAGRFPGKWVLLSANSFKVVCQLATVAVLFDARGPTWALITLQCGYGAAVAAYLPTTNGLIKNLVALPQLQAANAQVGIATSLAGGMGPILAAAVLAIAAPVFSLAAGVLSSIIAITLFATLPRQPASHTSRVPLANGLGQSWKCFCAMRWLWSGVIFLCLFQFFVLGLYYVGGPLVAARQLGGPSVWGLIAAAYGCGTIAGSALTFRWSTRNPLFALYGALLLMVPALLCLGYAAPLGVQLLFHAVAGAGMAYSSVLWDLSVQVSTDQQHISQISAFEWFGSTALRPFGLALAGPIITSIGSRTSFVAAALILAVGGVMMIILTSRMISRPLAVKNRVAT